jgi:hypothetical protein
MVVLVGRPCDSLRFRWRDINSNIDYQIKRNLAVRSLFFVLLS